jgi:hypothetical protein
VTAAGPDRLAMAVRGGWLGLLLLVGSGGCVGLTRSHLDWVAVTLDVTTRSEALARFGAPRRTAQEAGREVWYYRLAAPGPSGRRPVTEAPNVVFVVFLPVPWFTRPAENMRLGFEGDAVSSADELQATERTFFCGLNLVHGPPFVCGPAP